jgi:conjugal transfer pilus assembly protein TraB
MANLNQWVARQQRKTLVMVALCIILVLSACLLLVPKKKPVIKETAPLNLTGIVDESFSEANAESAMSMQQAELESLKRQIKELKDNIQNRDNAQADALAKIVAEQVKAVEVNTAHTVQLAENQNIPMSFAARPTPTRLHSVSFHYGKPHHTFNHRLSPLKYVPSGTFVRAVVLGGADADASVNGQSKNNGVMLFKLLQPGTLPNGQHSNLQGCFVTASSYGDISSERAYVVLDKLSCAHPGEPIIDKSVTGWAFFGGKVGIKGVPLMRDNKVMQWAGISGAMSGIASAAQYSQSVQSISALGSATSVPSGNIAPYAAYGGASKAAEVLSNYYVKRAEQYHPVIQVGSGNLVTIVFKDGFYLEPDEAQKSTHQAFSTKTEEGEPDFNVPPEVLSKINSSYGAQNGVEP